MPVLYCFRRYIILQWGFFDSICTQMRKCRTARAVWCLTLAWWTILAEISNRQSCQCARFHFRTSWSESIDVCCNLFLQYTLSSQYKAKREILPIKQQDSLCMLSHTPVRPYSPSMSSCVRALLVLRALPLVEHTPSPCCTRQRIPCNISSVSTMPVPVVTTGTVKELQHLDYSLVQSPRVEQLNFLQLACQQGFSASQGWYSLWKLAAKTGESLKFNLIGKML